MGENTGKSAVKYFLFSVDPSFKSKVAFVGATSGSSEKTYLRVTESKVAASPSVPFWRIDLKSALAGCFYHSSRRGCLGWCP